MRNRIADILEKSYTLRTAIGSTVMFLLITSVIHIGEPLYYRLMGGDWWVQYSAVVTQGDEYPELTLHRTQRLDLIYFNGVRTIVGDTGVKAERVIPARATGLQFAIAENRQASVGPIELDWHPQVTDYYKVITCIRFEVRGYPKSMCYESNEYYYEVKEADNG